ncbi:hypothetical protein COOONC_02126 [Cooperia oncophora]
MSETLLWRTLCKVFRFFRPICGPPETSSIIAHNKAKRIKLR